MSHIFCIQSEICCCNKDSCNDTPYKTGVEQVTAGAGSEPEPKGGKPTTTGAQGKGNGASFTTASIGVLAIALARVFA